MNSLFRRSADLSFLAHRAKEVERAQAGLSAPPRRVLTRDEAHTLATFVQQQVGGTWTPQITITSAVTSAATQRIGFAPQSADVDELLVGWTTQLGSYITVAIDTNVRDADTLRRVIGHVSAVQTPQRLRTADDDEDADPSLNHRSAYLPVMLWHDRTIAGMMNGRGDALAKLSLPFRGTSWHGMGTVALSAQSFFLLGDDLANATFGEMTDSEISMTARAADGSAVGWSSRAHRDWSQIDPEQVAREAITMAEQHRNPSRVEPGRYTAILSATAVGQLLRTMAPLYNVVSDSPFNMPNSKKAGDPDRRGQRVFDPRVTLWTDPMDPDGGEYPFDDGGTPNPKTTWVDHGVLKARSAGLRDALDLGLTPRKNPVSIRMSGGPTSIDDMIAHCERGIYVNRFANLDIIDGHSGAMSGFTRDGCLLILNGKIARPVKDFRIFESPFLSLNRVLALGEPRRVAFGFIPPQATDYHEHWPLPPVIAPPMMVTDFNFAALADAV